MSKIEDKTQYPYFYFKRIVDIIVSILILIISFPIIVLFSVLIILESPGGIFYSQERIGHLGKKIKIVKLRSMAHDAEKNGAQWANQNDTRVTKVGSVIRKTRIDELPQLWNVIIGDMSLIGPRPEREVFIREFLEDIPNFNDRLQVLPGLSGLAQVNGGYESTPREKLEFDLMYIENYGLKQDLNIFFKTIKVVLSGEGAR